LLWIGVALFVVVKTNFNKIKCKERNIQIRD